MKSLMKFFRSLFAVVLLGGVGYVGYRYYYQYIQENAVLRQIADRLQADSRVAEVLVTGVNFDEQKRQTFTTIKFLEYDSKGRPLEPRYFTFSGNIIQFQSLVIRFDDFYIRRGDKLRGRSAYLFWKVFMLDGANTQESEITEARTIPSGYKLEGTTHPFEEKLWAEFWTYALDPQKAGSGGIKNAQIEAPGTMFVPGVLYTIKIEHDGGLRIDAAQLSPILKGEKIMSY